MLKNRLIFLCFYPLHDIGKGSTFFISEKKIYIPSTSAFVVISERTGESNGGSCERRL